MNSQSYPLWPKFWSIFGLDLELITNFSEGLTHRLAAIEIGFVT